MIAGSGNQFPGLLIVRTIRDRIRLWSMMVWPWLRDNGGSAGGRRGVDCARYAKSICTPCARFPRRRQFHLSISSPGSGGYAYVDNSPGDSAGPLRLSGYRYPGLTPFPYDPKFNECSQYLSTTWVGKKLNYLCRNLGTSPRTNWARKRLRDALPPGRGGNSPYYWFMPQHPICWRECGWPFR